MDSYTNIQSVKLFAHFDTEENYAFEAIENARQKFSTQMRLITIMELGLSTINGLLIVAVIGWAIVLWQQGATTLGTIAAASALTLRLSAMTGWIMWSLSSLFQHLGVVAEGMETIAQPIDLLDAKDASELVVGNGDVTIRNLSHHYGKKAGGLTRVSASIKGGEKGWPCRPVWCR